MAVFTEVSPDEARTFIAGLGVGTLLELRGIRAGIENTNYFVTTDRGEYVLTIFERLTFEQLPFYLHLMQHLAQRGIPVPDPHADAAGQILHTLKGKPAALVDKLDGEHQLAPDLHHCAQVGGMLARMHLAGADYPRQQPNLRGLAWWTDTIPLVLPHLAPGQHALISEELAFQQALAESAAFQSLPRGPIHADLFRDNVMFAGLPGHEKLTGFFDFYFAGVDTLLFDIAVCLNDWCIDLDTGTLVEERAAAFVAAYERERRLDGNEHRLLPALMRAAALRFWTSRLWDFHLPRDATLLKPHDPTHFERVLRARVERPWHPAR
ncbi:homoserine kinase [Aquincola sp. J276]|uniref:homoserine kinase n=1 Tax=Aquincola sp. J276 TaxID=2898432 RepID=UPI0021516E8C|nr:homoserine kinase [Aquincola sp. J276]MCR5865458.1 homoserine kinase [Aquincola sp. J276]